MAPMDAAWMKELLEMFRVEGAEHIKAMSEGLARLEHEADDGDASQIEVVFREAHSLKGAARSIGLVEIESVCQAMEDVLAQCKHHGLCFKPHDFDVFQSCLRTLDNVIRKKKTLDAGYWNQRILKILTDCPDSAEDKSLQSADSSSDQVSRETLHEARMETLRLSADRLEQLMLSAEEFIGPKLAMDHLAADIRMLFQDLIQWKEELELNRRLSQQSYGSDQSGNEREMILESVTDRLLIMESELGRIAQTSELEARRFGGMVDRMIDEMKNTLMLPFDNLLGIMPATIRDIAQALDKRVKLTQEGGHIEADRRILDGLKDPLIHLLRNAVDHGIERKEERLAAGKEEVGHIGLGVTPLDEGEIEVRLWDDGGGIDVTAVKQAAIRKGFVTAEAAESMSNTEAMELIFMSDMSTRTTIDELSGRGLGLAIVRDRIEDMGGRLVLESEPGKGSTFRMILPSKLANFRGIVVEAAGQLMVLPTHSVQRTGRIRRDEIKDVDGETAILDEGNYIAFRQLESLLSLPGSERVRQTSKYQQIVVLASHQSRVAIGVDEVHREQEVLIKSLGKQLVRVRNVSGATVLGNGQIAPVLNGTDLVQASLKPAAPPDSEGPSAARNKTVMISEDSITTRMVMRRLLLSAGYSVVTAVDGMDAMSQLQNHDVDLIVSDVEMPRMSGFELARRVRRHPVYSELPFILVTGLEGREHKERGLEVGANAYLSKKKFEQGELLKIIKQLIGS